MRCVVTCNGCFNGLHPGHLFFLGFARGQGTELVVGINSDRYIRAKKGYTPFSEQERREDLMMLGFIREVVVFDESDPCEFIRRVSPEVHCTGEEYKGACPESSICSALGTKLVFIPRIGKWSTRALLRGEIGYDGNLKVVSPQKT
jgi:D-beta-D-heptose 7-phosphate kinase / D-beta-D-heptose 1-phosphate adenosyltransferase